MASFPARPDKYDSPEVITAVAAVADWQSRGLVTYGLEASGAILVYDRTLYRHLLEREELEPVRFGGPGRFHRLGRAGGDVLMVGDFGIGAPVAAAVVEAMIAAGVEKIVSIGTAGGLQQNLRPGDIIGVTGAVRDDGTSWHYLPGDQPVAPDEHLTDQLFDHIGALLSRTGDVWTTDAIYRETVAELRAHRDAGVLAVEMEAAALMAVCEVRQVPFATAVCISDVLSETGWEALFTAPPVRDALDALFDAAVATLT